MAYRSRNSGRKSYGRGGYRAFGKTRAKRRTSGSRRGGSTGGVMKLVIEHVTSSPVSRPDLAGMGYTVSPKGKAKL